ncbi:hypothetical protein NCCP2222_38800 [Sporosarcina sp. NCCP-2222]|uniref:DUF3977 family protein n=1 Tax=Sporosarcina sp. NCCP-2222 TaxID=2935073 RepID=UPI0020816645|nr:DUF3977 family protein [Sporosarcina sp. NCCP-2222]GKV57933.1 hypothetical protein NCCP2222_38800 [Sporosarcina sp. NCCP-2222]
MKFIEFGIGNKWLIRTEKELCDGTEVEEKGITSPIHIESIYVRVWLWKKVMIVDSEEGIKVGRKNKAKVKIILGIKSLS